MTIRDLVLAVRRNLRTENLPINDAQIADFVVETIADLAEDYDLLTNHYEYNTRRELASYRLPSDVKRVLFVFYRPSASAVVPLVGGVSGDEITTNQDLVQRGWKPKGSFRWEFNGRIYKADYELLDNNRLRFVPYRPPDGVIEPLVMDLPNAKPMKSYIFEPILPTTEPINPYSGVGGQLTIYEEANWVQVHPTTVSEVGVLGGTHLGNRSGKYIFATDSYEGTQRVWFMADKDGTKNLRVYTLNRFVIPPNYAPDTLMVPEQLRYRRLIVVIAVKRILTAFMGEEAMSWINLLTSEETQLRRAIRPPIWDISGVGGLDVIRREGGVLNG